MSPAAPAGFDLRPLARRLWRERWSLVVTALVAGALTLGVAFLIPKTYMATAVILPPEDSDLLTNMSIAQRALTKFPAFGILADYSTPADIYKAVLQSRTVQEELVEKFDLKRIYRKTSLEKTLKTLKANTKVKLNPDGTISVSVVDRDRRRAADIANAYLVGLDHYNVEKRNTQARRTRQFLERRVADTDSLLRACEQAVRLYEEAHHTVAPTTVASGDVQAAADLMARKIMLEVRLGVLRSYLREDNEQIVQTRTELDQLKDRIGQLPGLQNDLARLVRDQKIQEQLYLLLTGELEQARIRETMDTPTVQVLDPAQPPERHHSPHRALLAVAAAVLAAAGYVVWAAAREGGEGAIAA